MWKVALVLVFVLLLGLAACGGDAAPAGEPAAEGDATTGKALFVQGTIGSQVGCAICHSLEPGVMGLGPSLATVGTEAGNRVADTSAVDYLRESIVAPDAHIVEGFAGGLMPPTYGDELTEQQVADLVAFLLTLK